MAGITIVPMPSQGTVAGRPRREDIYDTECYPNNVALANQLVLFQNFSAFAFAPVGVALTKTFGRDTNLRGAGSGGLPAATHFYWYGWNLKYRTLGANLNTDANGVAFEQLNRMRELAFVQFNFTTANLITVQADELPSGTGPAFVATTRPNITALSLPSGTPDKKNSKDVTIMGRPVQLNALEGFTVLVAVQQAAFTPTLDVFVSSTLRGVLLRGLSA